jgi:hypothetical protein
MSSYFELCHYYSNVRLSAYSRLQNHHNNTNGNNNITYRLRISNKYGSVTALKQRPNQTYVLEGGVSNQI